LAEKQRESDPEEAAHEILRRNARWRGRTSQREEKLSEGAGNV
jgi:hypothetical protein